MYRERNKKINMSLHWLRIRNTSDYLIRKSSDLEFSQCVFLSLRRKLILTVIWRTEQQTLANNHYFLTNENCLPTLGCISKLLNSMFVYKHTACHRRFYFPIIFFFMHTTFPLLQNLSYARVAVIFVNKTPN